MAQAETTRRQVRTSILVVASLLVWSASTTTAAGAAPQGAPPPELVASAYDGFFGTASTCDETTDVITPGNLTVERPGTTSGTLSVDVSYGGTLVPGTDYDPLPDPIEIPAGQRATTVEVEASRSGTVVLTVEPGEAYAVGEPSSATATFSESNWEAECPPEETQTIAVGTAPASLDLVGRFGDPGDSYFEIEGDLPPGLTLDRVGDWTGTATRVGTYRFVAKYTNGVISAVELPVRIVVVPAGAPTAPGAPPTAAPAAPIPGRASFTG